MQISRYNSTNTSIRFYSMEEVNFEWPVRLAQLVADKCDDTKLIHVTNLACNQPKARQISKLIKLQVS